MTPATTSIRYGGFVSRLLAFLIDLVLISLITFLVSAGLGVIAGFFGLDTNGISFVGVDPAQLPPFQRLIATFSVLFSTFFGLIYFLFFWVLVSFTPGMALLGLKIVRCDGRQLGLGRAIVRLIGYWISLIFIGLGFLWILIDNRRQGWHDKMAGSCIIYFDRPLVK